jgi:hypothetical protein
MAVISVNSIKNREEKCHFFSSIFDLFKVFKFIKNTIS